MKRALEEEPSADEAAADDPPARFETNADAYVDAGSALRLRFQHANEATYNPEFTHQIFDPDGAIECPLAERPLRIDIVYAPATLDVRWSIIGDASASATAALACLASAMPAPAGDQRPITTASELEALAGAVVCTYTHLGSEYTVHAAKLAGAPAARVRFSERLQTLFRFAIETSSPIDHADERWELLAVFQAPPPGSGEVEKEEREYRLVAAATLFRFQRWMAGRGPVPLLRLCQVTTLPPYRGAGHGARLLNAVYERAASLGAAELTIEDPNDGCRLLRDRVDYRNACDRGLLPPAPTADAIAPPTSEALAQAREALLLTEEQCLRVSEMRQLAELRKRGEGDTDEALKPLRLAAKRRLAKKHKEELDALLSIQEHTGEDGDKGAGSKAADAPPTPTRDALVAAKKERLEQLWLELLQEYDAAIAVRG